MEVTDTQLTERYASLETTELVELFNLDSLTQQARPILEKELASRGIDPSGLKTEQYNDDAIMEIVRTFMDESMAAVDRERFRNSTEQKYIVFSYCFGAIDYLAKISDIQQAETLALATLFIADYFKTASDPVNMGDVGKVLIEVSQVSVGKWLMKEGGDTISNWLEKKDARAPEKLAELFRIAAACCVRERETAKSTIFILWIVGIIAALVGAAIAGWAWLLILIVPAVVKALIDSSACYRIARERGLDFYSVHQYWRESQKLDVRTAQWRQEVQRKNLSVATAQADLWEDAKAAHFRGDYATALRLYRPLAETGHVGAQFNLGVMYESGQGVPQDDAEAMKWFRLAAAQGHARAQGSLGFMYDNGRGVPQDYAEAVKWYRLAAEQGVAEAQYNLGVMYDNGRGVPQDYAEALKWYRLAAAQGYASAQGNLGVMYVNGQGVPQSLVQYEMSLKGDRCF